MWHRLIFIILAILSLAGCRTIQSAEATEDSLSIRETVTFYDTLIVFRWTADSLSTDTRLTVVLNDKGDTIRTDRTTTKVRTKNLVTSAQRTQYRDRYLNINHWHYRTITKTVTVKEQTLWQRIQTAAFWILLFIIAAITVILKVKNKFL